MWVENGRLYDRYKDNDGKLRKISVPLPKDTPQARRIAQNALSEKIADKLSGVSKLRLNDALEIYFSQKNVKLTTYKNERSAFNQVAKILGDIPVKTISSPLVKRQFSTSGKPASALNRYIVLFNTFLKWCYEYGHITAPIKISAFPVNPEKKDAGDLYLERDELLHVLDVLDGTMDGYLCRFMALTGCRVGEAVALTVDDVDDYVHITKTRTYLRTIQTPKTATSERDIYVQPELRAMLRDFYEWRRLHMFAHGIRTDLLFYSAQGHSLNLNRLRAVLRKIDPKVHPHIFRHTHVALLAEQGVPLEAISRRLGHSDAKITAKVYYHVTEKTKKREEEIIAKTSIL